MLIARWKSLELDAAELVREQALHLRVGPAPPLDAAADEVLEHAALRLVQRERGAAAERRPLERRVDVVLVQRVPALVHRREHAAHLVLRVVRGHPDVRRAERRREGVRDRVDPPACPRGSRSATSRILCISRCGLDREVAAETASRRSSCSDASATIGTSPSRSCANTSRTSAVFIPCSKSSSSASYGSSASKQAAYSAPELDVPLQVRAEQLEVVRAAGLDPDRERLGAGSRLRLPQLAGDAELLVAVAARDADQARLVRVVVERLLVRPELIEQLAELLGDDLLVDDLGDRRQLLCAHVRAGARHHRLLVPGGDRAQLRQVPRLGQAVAQLGVAGVGHPAEPYALAGSPRRHADGAGRSARSVRSRRRTLRRSARGGGAAGPSAGRLRGGAPGRGRCRSRSPSRSSRIRPT